MTYGNGDIIKVINEDCTGRKLMRKTANADDAESVKDAFNSVIEKYGLNIKVQKIDKDNPWKENKDFEW